MRYFHTIPEYRFVLPGRAISFRSPRARAYKKTVRKAARRVFSGHASNQKVNVYVDYFHTKPRRVDVDNVAKCIMDALSDIAYVDDRQVRIQKASAYSLQSIVQIRGGPVDLVKPLKTLQEYVFVRIRLS
jgi:Holliday junction resolvase RusA-like endonuclease